MHPYKRAYIDHLIDRDEFRERERFNEHDRGYLESMIERDRQQYIKDCAYDLSDELDRREALLGMTRAVDQVYSDRFDLKKVARRMDGEETAFQRFLRLHHGLTPVFGPVDDFLDYELVIIKESEGDQCYQMPYRKVKKYIP